MAQPPTGNLVKWWPPGEEMTLKDRLLYNAVNDHDQAITLLSAKFDSTMAATAPAPAAIVTSGVFPYNTPAVSGEFFNAYDAGTGMFSAAPVQTADSSLLGIVEPDNVTIGIDSGILFTQVFVDSGPPGATPITPGNPFYFNNDSSPWPAYVWHDSGWNAFGGGGGGGVSSVGLTVPSRQSVSGSPVTFSGTLGITDNTQTANEVFAGPGSGSAAAPTFRALVSADLPVATTGALGAVEPDGTTITISAGVISAAAALTNPMTTEGDIIYGGASGTPTRLAAGTSGNVLQTNGSGAAPTWVAAGGGGSGALVLLEEHTASSSASLAFTSSISSTYDLYQIELINIVPATNGASLVMRMSTNGGSSYDSGSNYSWAQWEWTSSASAANGSSSDTSMTVIRGMKTGGNYSGNGSYKLYNPASASLFKQLKGEYTTQDSGNGVLNGYANASAYLSLTAVNAFEFVMSSGNIASGTVRVYGLTH